MNRVFDEIGLIFLIYVFRHRDWLCFLRCRLLFGDLEQLGRVEVILPALVHDAIPTALDGDDLVFLAVGKREGVALSYELNFRLPSFFELAIISCRLFVLGMSLKEAAKRLFADSLGRVVWIECDGVVDGGVAEDGKNGCFAPAPSHPQSRFAEVWV